MLEISDLPFKHLIREGEKIFSSPFEFTQKGGTGDNMK